MHKIYRFPINTFNIDAETKLNKFKLECKDKALEEFIKEYSILDVKTITFDESVEKDLPNITVYYYVDIVTSEL